MNILENDKPIAICCDHAGFSTKQAIIKYLEEQKMPYKDFGTFNEESCDYPDFAHPCALAVESGECYPAISICGSGNGVQMTMNKHQGIRAALCWCEEIATLARMHNDANVLSLPGRFIKFDTAIKITDAFLHTRFEGGRHTRRIEKIPIK